MMNLKIQIINFINIGVDIYFYVILLYIFATWIPNINWKKQPWVLFAAISNIYLDIFEKIIPRWGCIIGIIVLQMIRNYLKSLV